MMVRAASSIPSSSTRLRIVVPGLLSQRARAVRFVLGACRAHALGCDVEHALVSAVGEAFNFAVAHGEGDPAGNVAVELELARDRAIVTLRDRGPGFDARGGDADTRQARRYGLFIMLRALDEVRWYRERDENVVVMAKRLPITRR